MRIVFLILVFLTACTPAMQTQFLNKPAPVTVMTQTDGRSVALSQFRGTPVVLCFWALWCKQSPEVMAKLDKFAEQNRDIPVFAVSIDKLEKEEEVLDRIKRYPYLRHVYSGNDIGDSAYVAWQGEMIPFVAVIDSQGIVRYSKDEISEEFYKAPK